MTQKVIIIGGVGSGTVIAQAIKDSNLKGARDIEVEGFINDRVEPGQMIEDIPVLGKQSKESIQIYYEQGYKFIYTLHSTDSGTHFVDLFDELSLTPEMLVTFIHSTAYVAPNAFIEPGVIIMPYAMVASHAHIGLNSLIMIGSTVGHNSKLANFTHVAAQSIVGAFVKTGVSSHFGMNSTSLEYLNVGNYSTIGMGGVLTKDIPDGEVWVGNPAKFLRMAKTTYSRRE